MKLNSNNQDNELTFISIIIFTNGGAESYRRMNPRLGPFSLRSLLLLLLQRISHRVSFFACKTPPAIWITWALELMGSKGFLQKVFPIRSKDDVFR